MPSSTGRTLFLLVVASSGCGRLIDADWSGHPRDESAPPSNPTDDGGALVDASTVDASSPSDGSAPVEAGTPTAFTCTSTAPATSTCSCIAIGTGETDASCDEATFANAVCCADDDYPSSGDCTCAGFWCRPTTSGEMCGPYGDASAPASSNGTHCCAHPFFNSCGCADDASKACPSALLETNNVPVAACTSELQPCRTGQKRVASCTP